jgi:branched-subunit amino acid transport protein
VSDAWLVVLVVGAATIACKAAGPVLLGGRRLTGRVSRVVDLLAPVLLVSLVVTQLVGGDRELVLDERLAGLGAAGIAYWRGAPIVGAMAIAAVVTAALRALT